MSAFPFQTSTFAVIAVQYENKIANSWNAVLVKLCCCSNTSDSLSKQVHYCAKTRANTNFALRPQFGQTSLHIKPKLYNLLSNLLCSSLYRVQMCACVSWQQHHQHFFSSAKAKAWCPAWKHFSHLFCPPSCLLVRLMEKANDLHWLMSVTSLQFLSTL